jgi:hypothetical protein
MSGYRFVNGMECGLLSQWRQNDMTDYVSDWTSIRVDRETKDRIDEMKDDEKSWNDFLNQCADIVENGELDAQNADTDTEQILNRLDDLEVGLRRKIERELHG